jgi:hypothetical protein
MNISQEFLDNLPFKGGWRLETIGERTFYTLVDPIYCNVFWMYYWYNIGAVNFKNQDFLVTLADGVITHKVILDPSNGNLILPPSGWNLIAYLGTADATEKPPIYIQFSPIILLISYIIIMIIILIFVIILKPERQISII